MMEPGILAITVVGAKNLPPKDANGLADPYVEVAIYNFQRELVGKRKSAVIKKTLEPEWNERFEYTLPKGECTGLKVILWDKDPFKSDFMGKVVINDVSLLRRQKTEQWIPLRPSKRFKSKVVTGEILIETEFVKTRSIPHTLITADDSGEEAQQQGSAKTGGSRLGNSIGTKIKHKLTKMSTPSVAMMSGDNYLSPSHSLTSSDTSPSTSPNTSFSSLSVPSSSSLSTQSEKSLEKIEKVFEIKIDRENEVFYGDHHCSYNKREKRGQLWITSKNFYFYSQLLGKIFITIPVDTISRIEKTKGAVIDHNITVITNNNDEHLFQGFLRRDAVYDEMQAALSKFLSSKYRNTDFSTSEPELERDRMPAAPELEPEKVKKDVKMGDVVFLDRSLTNITELKGSSSKEDLQNEAEEVLESMTAEAGLEKPSKSGKREDGDLRMVGEASSHAVLNPLANSTQVSANLKASEPVGQAIDPKPQTQAQTQAQTQTQAQIQTAPPTGAKPKSADIASVPTNFLSASTPAPAIASSIDSKDKVKADAVKIGRSAMDSIASHEAQDHLEEHKHKSEKPNKTEKLQNTRKRIQQQRSQSETLRKIAETQHKQQLAEKKVNEGNGPKVVANQVLLVSPPVPSTRDRLIMTLVVVMILTLSIGGVATNTWLSWFVYCGMITGYAVQIQPFLASPLSVYGQMAACKICKSKDWKFSILCQIFPLIMMPFTISGIVVTLSILLNGIVISAFFRGVILVPFIVSAVTQYIGGIRMINLNQLLH